MPPKAQTAQTGCSSQAPNTQGSELWSLLRDFKATRVAAGVSIQKLTSHATMQAIAFTDEASSCDHRQTYDINEEFHVTPDLLHHLKRHPQWLSFSRDRRRRTGYTVKTLPQDASTGHESMSRAGGAGGEARYRQHAEALGVLLEEGRAVHVSPRAATGWFHQRVAQAEAKARAEENAIGAATASEQHSDEGESTSLQAPPIPVVARATSSVHVQVQVSQRQVRAREALFETPYKRITHVSSDPRTLKPLPKHRPAKNEVELIKRHVNARRHLAAAERADTNSSTPLQAPILGHSQSAASLRPSKALTLQADALPTLLSPIKPRASRMARVAGLLLKAGGGAVGGAGATNQSQATPPNSLSPKASTHASSTGPGSPTAFGKEGGAKQAGAPPRLKVQTLSPSTRDSTGHATGLLNAVETMALVSSSADRMATSDSLFSVSVRSMSIASPSAAHRQAEREASFDPLGAQQRASHPTTPSTRASVATHSTFEEHSVFVSSAYAVWSLLFLRRTVRQLMALGGQGSAAPATHRQSALHQPTLLNEGSDLSSGMYTASRGPVFWKRQAAALRSTGLGGVQGGAKAASHEPSQFDITRSSDLDEPWGQGVLASPGGGGLHSLPHSGARSRSPPLSPTAAAHHRSNHTIQAGRLPSAEDAERAHRIAMDAGIAGGGALGYGFMGVYPLPATSRKLGAGSSKRGNKLVAGRRGAKLQVQAVITAAQLGAAQDVLPQSALRFLGISGEAVRASADTSSMHQLMLDTLEAAEMKRAIAIAYAHAQCLSALAEAHSLGLHRRKARACMLAMSQRDVLQARQALAQLKLQRRTDAATDEALQGLGLPGLPETPQLALEASTGDKPGVRLKPLPDVGSAVCAAEQGPVVLKGGSSSAQGGLDAFLHTAIAPLLALAHMPNPKLALSQAKTAHRSALGASKTTNVTGSAFKKSAFGVRAYPEVLVAEGACTRVTMEATTIKVELTLSDTISRRAVTQLEREVILHPPQLPTGTGHTAGRFDADAHVDRYFELLCSALKGASQQRRLSALETGVEGTIRGDRDVMHVTLSLHHAQLCRLPHLTLTQRCSVAMLFQELLEAQVLMAVMRVDAVHCAALSRGGLPLPQLPVRSLSKLRSALGALLARGRLSDAFAGVVNRVCAEPHSYDVVQLVADGHGPSAAGLLEAGHGKTHSAKQQAQMHTDQATEAANAAVPKSIQEFGVFSVFLQPYQLKALLEEVAQDSRAMQATIAISSAAQANRQQQHKQELKPVRTPAKHRFATPRKQAAPATAPKPRLRPWRLEGAHSHPHTAHSDSRPTSAITARSRSSFAANAPALRVSQSASRGVLRAQRALLAWGEANKAQDSQEEQRQQALAALAASRLQHVQDRLQQRKEEEHSRLVLHGGQMGGSLGGSLSTPQLPSARGLAADVQEVMQLRGAGDISSAHVAVGARKAGMLSDPALMGVKESDPAPPAATTSTLVAFTTAASSMVRYESMVALQEAMSRFRLESAQSNQQLRGGAGAGGGVSAAIWQRCALLGDMLVLLLTVSKTLMQPMQAHAAVVRRSLRRLLRGAFQKEQHGEESHSEHDDDDAEDATGPWGGATLAGMHLNSSASSGSGNSDGESHHSGRGDSDNSEGHLIMTPEDELELLARHPDMRGKALRHHPSLAACKLLLGNPSLREWRQRTQQVALAAGPMVLTGMGQGGDDHDWAAQQQSLALVCPAPVLLGPMGTAFLKECDVAPSAIRAAASMAHKDGFGAETLCTSGQQRVRLGGESEDDILLALQAQPLLGGARGGGIGPTDDLPPELVSAAASLRRAGQHVRAVGVTATCEEMTLAGNLWLQRLVDAALHELMRLLGQLQVSALSTALRVPRAARRGQGAGRGGGAAAESADHVFVPLLDFHAWLGE